jgi:hypothetical protein
MTDKPGTPMTPAEQIDRLRWMLDQCERNGWVYLAEWLQQSLDKLEDTSGKNDNRVIM